MKYRSSWRRKSSPSLAPPTGITSKIRAVFLEEKSLSPCASLWRTSSLFWPSSCRAMGPRAAVAASGPARKNDALSQSRREEKEKKRRRKEWKMKKVDGNKIRAVLLGADATQRPFRSAAGRRRLCCTCTCSRGRWAWPGGGRGRRPAGGGRSRRRSRRPVFCAR